MKKKTYIIYWLDGKTTKVYGFSIEDAFKNAGYSAGAVAAVDYYKEVK